MNVTIFSTHLEQIDYSIALNLHRWLPQRRHFLEKTRLIGLCIFFAGICTHDYASHMWRKDGIKIKLGNWYLSKHWHMCRPTLDRLRISYNQWQLLKKNGRKTESVYSPPFPCLIHFLLFLWVKINNFFLWVKIQWNSQGVYLIRHLCLPSTWIPFLTWVNFNPDMEM